MKLLYAYKFGVFSRFVFRVFSFVPKYWVTCHTVNENKHHPGDVNCFVNVVFFRKTDGSNVMVGQTKGEMYWNVLQALVRSC